MEHDMLIKCTRHVIIKYDTARRAIVHINRNIYINTTTTDQACILHKEKVEEEEEKNATLS